MNNLLPQDRRELVFDYMLFLMKFPYEEYHKLRRAELLEVTNYIRRDKEAQRDFSYFEREFIEGELSDMFDEEQKKLLIRNHRELGILALHG